jgi:hypothetical protein
MKYWIKRACGHEEQIEVFGKVSEREYRIKSEEKKTCRECYQAEQYKDCDEVEMTYAEYKRNYADCKTKSGSYDAKSKTIIVYVPKTPPEEKPETDTIEGRKAAIKKVAEETGLPIEVLEKIFMVFDAEQYLKQAEAHADILKTNPDKTGKYENAYIAAITLGRVALEYGL